MGKHHGLWNDQIDDPDEVMSRWLGIPKHLLPTHLDEPGVVEGDLIELSDDNDDVL
jgi:hypothetical protein